MSRANPGPRPPPEIGLCADCRFVRAQGTKRGTTFYRCARADEDELFLRYPPLPLDACAGFEALDQR